MKVNLNNSRNFLSNFDIRIEEPKTIYHYTNPTGLLGIILNKKLWTSDIQYLNDMEEFKYASSFIIKEVKSLINSFDKISTKITDMIDRTSILKEYQIYVCSFSEEGNLLSQWRAYSPDFNGFSIGFNFSEIQQLASKQKYYLFPCIYERKIQKAIIDKMVKLFFQTLYEILKKNTDITHSLDNFILQYIVISSILKNNSFKEEKEWRLIGIRKKSKQTIKYRTNKSMIIPYIEFDFSNSSNPINEIYIGPSPHINLSFNSVLDILNQEKIKGKVIKSRIPYRNW